MARYDKYAEDYKALVRARIRAGAKGNIVSTRSTPNVSSSMVDSDMSRNPSLTVAGNTGTPGSPDKWQKVFGNLQQGAQDVAPYLSNIVNAFRKPPAPAVPGRISPVRAPQVDYSAQRVEADRQRRGLNLNADRTLDPNTAAGVQASSLAGSIGAKNQINESEKNTNAGLRFSAAQMNAGIDYQNTAMMNNYNDQVVQSKIAQQREQSENLANAVDKHIASGNEKAKAQLEMTKYGALSRLWDPALNDRLMKYYKDQGIEDPTGLANWGVIDPTKKDMGGRLKKVYPDGGDLSKYSQWGNLASTVQEEGWKPSMWDNDGTVEYTNSYNAAGNNALIDNMPTGQTVIRGSRNGRFDVLMRDTAGKRKDSFIHQGVTAEQAHGYFVKPDGTVAQRVAGIQDRQIASYREGGSIHIKPENRGKFTAYKKRTGTTTSEALHSKDPHVRQMANFARNAKKWKHAEGGTLTKVF